MAGSSKRGDSALRYHEATKHSELSLRTSGHYLDWDNKPAPFKVYKHVPSTLLPHKFPKPSQESLNAIKPQKPRHVGGRISLPSLTEILFYTGGITRKMRIGGETHYMRAASATGALYPIELYIVCNGIQGFESGVYHFDPLSFSLAEIRGGDYNSELAMSTGGATASSHVTIVFASLAWKNSWKYEARSYRHWFWDAGVMMANLLATCTSEGLDAKLVTGFVDAEVDRLLGLKRDQEATVGLAAVGQGKQGLPGNRSNEISELDLPTEKLSNSQTEYPIIWQTNRASVLHNQAEIESWRESLAPSSPKQFNGHTFLLRPSTVKTPPIGDVILRRGSTRRFTQQPISFEALSTIIQTSTGPIPLDFLSDDNSLIEFYFIANDVQGLPSGAYYFDRTTKHLDQLNQARLRYVAGHLCLEQPLFSDASVVFFLMTDLERVLNNLGDRGYRAAQLEAGIRAGKIYLSSYAQTIGASGSTFYDDAVTEFFSPHAKAMSTMIAVGVGVPAYKAKPGKILPQFGQRT